MSKIWLLLFLLIAPLMSDIDELIESMQSVSDKERFKLMNQFKEEVINLQEEERMEAMKKVISITKSSHSDKVLEEVKRTGVKEKETKEKKNSSTKEIEDIDHVIESAEVSDEIETDKVEDEDND